MFSVISKGLLENQQPSKIRGFSLLTIHYLVVTQLVLNTYKIHVKKFSIICLTLYQEKPSQLIVFHGPGILSRKTQMHAKESNTLNVGTFQCLVQVLINNNDKTMEIKSSSFSFKSHKLPSKLIKVTENYDIVISFPPFISNN